jgi:hypothetical protein
MGDGPWTPGDVVELGGATELNARIEALLRQDSDHQRS